jgi:hypothetical protein
MSLTLIGVDEVGGTIALPVTDWPTPQTRLDISKVVWSIIMPKVAMGTAIVRQDGTRSKKKKKT